MNPAVTHKRRRGRPPKGHHNPNQTREALLRSGIELLTEKGFAATGLDEILQRVSVPKGSFYHYFNSKQEFGEALIRHYDDYFAHKLDRFLLDESHHPLQRLQNFTRDAAAGMARHQFRRGCLVGNLGQEMGALPESFRSQIIAIFESWQHKLENCLQLAQRHGQIDPTADCKKLSSVFWNGWEGAVLRAKLERCADPLTTFCDYFLYSLTIKPTTVNNQRG